MSIRSFSSSLLFPSKTAKAQQKLLKKEADQVCQETRVQEDFQAKLEELKDEFIELRDAQIRDHAYLLWEQAGCPHGCSDKFWLQAEEELSPEGFERRS